jgi:RNA-directed DNA polymerase
MKRLNNLFQDIISVDNLKIADQKASRGKSGQPGVISHRRNQDENLLQLHDLLKNRSFRTSEYKTFTIFEPKERLIFKLPYYPDRIVHHAIMNRLEDIFVSCFTTDTYSCIKGKGIHAAANGVKNSLLDVSGTRYCLKLDIKKFYPSIDHDILKALLRRRFKDLDLLWLLDEIIDSTDGLPIGNYLSQYLANFYLTRFDHWLKETKKVRYYFRYADDLVILSSDKSFLHQILGDIKGYLSTELKLTVKGNYQVFPVAARGIDFVGYVFYHTHVLIRKSIKQRFARMMARSRNPQSVAAYWGWLKHADTRNLIKKIGL